MNSIAVIERDKVMLPKFVMPYGSVVVSTEMEEPVVKDVDHKADPIKSIDDIISIRNYFHENLQFRDELMFIMGINFGLRISDLLKLRVGDIIDENLEYRRPILVQETKTGKPRRLYVNAAVHEAFSNYLSNINRINLNELLFEGYKGKPMTRQNVDRILRKTMKDLDMEYKCGTHMLRKTFAYWTLKTAKDKQRAMYILQKTFNHSSCTVTLFYAGITDDEIMETSLSLNLGYRSVLDVESNIVYTI